MEQRDHTVEESWTGLEIAVIGMAGKFPGAKNINEFWNNLKNGIESISFFSDEESIDSGVDPELLQNPNYVKACGTLEDKEIESFDSYFFDYFPKEAEKMDPQMRIFHECAWEVLENAGYNPASHPFSIGVFAGASSNFNWEFLSYFPGASGETDLDPFAIFLLADRDFLSSHVSYKLDLKGPVVALQTACSTSLAAIHQACRALLTGECDMALAGGVTIRIPQTRGYRYKQGMIHSPDGHCRAFDTRAKGTVSGNGIGIVALKRLKAAIADRDTIHALIKGSAINNDGSRKVGYTAPSVEGQVEVIQTAFQVAEVEPGSIGYIETHGTGTPLGDPVEVEALKIAFGMEKKGFCGIGSVKTNIGHLDSAAGVAGFIKTVLALKHKQLPPSLHLEIPNPKIDLDNSPFYVVTKLTGWKNDHYPMRAGISSFGIGGTNAHVVLEEAPAVSKSVNQGVSESVRKETVGREYQLMLLSAKTPAALDRMTDNLVEYLKKNPNIPWADAAYTLQVGRKAFSYRKMLVCLDGNEAIETLTSPDSGKVHTYWANEKQPAVIFMFPGQGAQYVNMGREIYQKEPYFRQEMNRCFEILKTLMGYDIKGIIYPGERKAQGAERKANKRQTRCAVRNAIDQTEITQPLLFVFEYTLAKMLMKWGITPYAMIGHSVGEYVAACLSGVFSLEDALMLVALRGKLMQQIPGGAMLSVSLSEEELKPLLKFGNEISLSAVNSSTLCVVSGSHEAIDNFAIKLKKKGYECRSIHTSHAFHSRMMDPILKKFEEEVAKVLLNQPVIPYLSNVTGKWITIEDAADPRYWANHIRKTVRFSEGLKELLKDTNRVFIEVGPGTVLSAFTRKYLDNKSNPLIVNLVRHPQEPTADDYYLLKKVGLLWLYGIEIDWYEFHQQENRYRIPLPTYPFEGQHFVVKSNPLTVSAAKLVKNSSGRKRIKIADWFYIPGWKRSEIALYKTDEMPVNSNILIFIDDGVLGSQMVKPLKQKGQNLITVKAGKTFEKESDDTYVLNPKKKHEYEALFLELYHLKCIPETIIHLWNVTDENNKELDFEVIEAAQDMGFYSLLHIIQAIDNQNIFNKIRLLVVANNLHAITGEEMLCPRKSTILGLVKVIPQEYPNINCRCIDIVLPGPGRMGYDNLIDHLLIELIVDSPDRVIVYRGKHRWVRIFEPVHLEKAQKMPLRLREKGVFLVTGGLGRIGLKLAEYLSKKVKAKLILIGSSPFPPKYEWDKCLHASKSIKDKILELKEMEENGAEVLVLQADVADQKQMQQAIDQAEASFGNIHGVIHAAGRIKDVFRSVKNLDKSTCEEQFRAKVYGLTVLEKILAGKKLDFCLLMSSLSSVLGGLGFAAYASANTFMDAFVHHHNDHLYHRSPANHAFWTSVNWDAWQLQGEDKTAGNTFGRKASVEMGMKPGEGIAAFENILTLGKISQLVVSVRELQPRIDEWIKFEPSRGTIGGNKEESPTRWSRAHLTEPFIPPRNHLEKKVADIWQEYLGIEAVGVHDNFFELGASSLDIIQVNRRLKTELAKDINVEVMFEYPSVSLLVDYLSGEEENQLSLPQSEKSIIRMEHTLKKLKGVKNG